MSIYICIYIYTYLHLFIILEQLKASKLVFAVCTWLNKYQNAEITNIPLHLIIF